MSAAFLPGLTPQQQSVMRAVGEDVDIEGHPGPPAGQVRFFAAGSPRAKGKLISGTRTDGSRYQYYPDNGHKEWREAIGYAATEAMAGRPLLNGPVYIQLTLYLPRAKSHYHTGKRAGVLRSDAPPKPAKAPDADKLMRAVGDALTGVCYRDDALITTALLRKRWGERTGAEVVLEEDREP